MSELRRRMLTDLRIRNYAERTQEIYIARVAEAACYFKRSPDGVTHEEVRSYLRYLKEERRVSRSAFAQTVGALRFLYRVTLDRGDMVPHLPYPRLKRRHPVVLSPEEVVRLLQAVWNLKHRTVAMVLYGAGLRISEGLKLQLRDVDSARMVLTVRHGKGDQDRQVALSPVLLEALRAYWRAYRPQSVAVPGAGEGPPVTSIGDPARPEGGTGAGGDREACDRSHAAAQLRDAPVVLRAAAIRISGNAATAVRARSAEVPAGSRSPWPRRCSRSR